MVSLFSRDNGDVLPNNLKLDGKDTKPRHVAIIMDGNGRWARARLMPRAFGHKAGVDTLRKIVRVAPDYGIETLSVYAFSTENWRRPKDEVDALLLLLKQFIKSDLKDLHKNNVCVKIQGRREGLPQDVLDLLDGVVKLTQDNTGLKLVICFNYGGQSEIVDAAIALAKDVKQGKIDVDNIDEKLFETYLYSAEWPHPDLIIRTAGEKRLSNFLAWQSAYSEFVFLEVLWPDFSEKDLALALDEFASRKRKFGGL